MTDDLYDSWAAIAARRGQGDVVPRPELGGYEALGYDAIVEVLRDAQTFSSRQTTMVPLEPSLANIDPPDHTVLRRTLIGVFSKAAVDELTPRIQREADEIIDGLPEPGTVVDVKNAYAVPLALHTIMHLLRIPESERARLRAGTEAIENVAAGVTRTPEIVDAITNLDRYFRELAEERIAAAERGELPNDPRDPTAALVWDHLNGIIDRRGVSRNLAVFFNGGNGTTTTMIANGVYALETHPAQKAAFLTDPDALIAGFVEETLRYEGSTHGLFRTATAECRVGDVDLHESDRIFCRFGAGSRDPRTFPDPDAFDIARDWDTLPPHLGFSLGSHRCLGAPLARVEMAIALTTLYRRLPGLRLAHSPDDRRLQGLIFRGWEKLHVVYDEKI